MISIERRVYRAHMEIGKMSKNNGKITRRINIFIRRVFLLRKKQNRMKKKDVTILCNNCTGGFIYHDLGMKFNSPTINMFFHGLDFFDFIEHLDYYIRKPLVQIPNPKYDPNAPDYPVAILEGNGDEIKDIELHFLHYRSFEEAATKWNSRKMRVQKDALYVIWTFMGMEPNAILYERAQSLPVQKKVIFVNHPVDNEKYPDFFYIKGFESQVGLGQLSAFMNLKGERYYDQFDFVNWLNNG